MKGDGVGDLAQHGEAERYGCWQEMMQELGREVESAGAELVGVLRRSSVCFSNFFRGQAKSGPKPRFKLRFYLSPGGGRAVGGGDEESGA